MEDWGEGKNPAVLPCKTGTSPPDVDVNIGSGSTAAGMAYGLHGL